MNVSTMWFAVTLLAATIGVGSGLELDPSNFDSTVVNSEDPFLVLFYAPWCGHCKNLFPHWEKAAKATKGIVSMAQVDASKHQELGGRYGVQGFPTIKIFGADKKHPSDYQGQRTTEGLVQGALQAAQGVMMARLGGGSGGGGGAGPGAVEDLTDGSFDSKVLQSDDLWIVAFTAPWCGHCKNLMPQFDRASSELKGRAKLGNVDATVHQGLAQRYQVQGYPTIKVFLPGKKDPQGQNYEGGRSASDIVAFAEEELLKVAPPPEVVEVNTNDDFEKECLKKQICFISFLPLLQDSGKSGREGHIQILKNIAEQFKRRPFGYIWVEGTTQPDMENLFDVGGFGYPAMIAVNSKKMRFATLKGQFSASGISSFVSRLVAGRGTVALNSDIPKLVETTKWNGEDFVPEVIEEEFDLSELDDIDLDDDDSNSKKDEL